MIPMVEHRPLLIYLTAEKNPGKPQLGNVDEGCTTSHRLKWGPFPQMTSVGLDNTSGRERGRKERKKERT